jgi:hypothetical protein
MDDLTALKAEFASLVLQSRELDAKKEALLQRILTLKAAHKVGDTIEWGSPDHVRRGVVRGYKPWMGDDVVYAVECLRKDGSRGRPARVYSYDKPRASSVAYSQSSAEGK